LPKDSILSEVLKIKGDSFAIKTYFLLNISDLIACCSGLIETKKLLIEEEIDFSTFTFNFWYCNYKGIRAKKIIFFEGAKIV